MGLLERELLAVFDAESPVEMEAVGDTERVLLPLSVEEGVMEAVPVPEGVGVAVEVGLGVERGVPLLE